ncbi:MAG: NAD-dependent epimerase/dehydratase family protein [Candidatus Zapsychrus exili]|nr:NAD-dependent epimerase/dehydratase family protein [Candidatus Zapsychrus exili]
MEQNSKILIVGANDVIENSLKDCLKASGFNNVFSSCKMALDAAIQSSVYHFFQQKRPEYVFLCSTRSGGIEANQKQAAEFIYHNQMSQSNVLYVANKFEVKKLIYFASSCVYPKICEQPMKEEYIGTGKMEETSVSYSTAKLAGIRSCQAFREQYGLNAIVAILPTIYGPQKKVNLKSAHVIEALIDKFKTAVVENQNEVIVWGTGKPRREFLHADDFASAALFLMDKYEDVELINIGCGYDVTINEVVQIIKDISGFKGNIIFDDSKPDGTMQKLLDNSKIIELGWNAEHDLLKGIKEMYNR